MYDVLIVGGGIVGLATGYQLLKKQPGIKLILIEKETDIAQHQTGNNSGVIHSGLYYKPGSLKATNCIEGYHLLVDFCKEYEVDFDLCGKVVVATSQEEVPLMENLLKRGIANGLTGLEQIGKERLREHEPHVNGVAGLWVPQTGIVDYVGMCRKMKTYIEHNGGQVILSERVTAIKKENNQSTVVTSETSYQTKLVINCAGLYSDKVAEMNTKDLDLKIIPFRGEYFEIKPEKHHLVKNLIYPVPDPNFPFLGVHFTRMIKGGVEAGPNAVFAFKREGYKMSDYDIKEMLESLSWPGFQKVAAKYWQTGMGEFYRSFSKTAFTKALQKLIPELQEEDLVPGGAGVRAQACDRTGGLLDDFAIIENNHVINVCNAPSPAATSSLAIGNTISEMALNKITL